MPDEVTDVSPGYRPHPVITRKDSQQKCPNDAIPSERRIGTAA